MGVERLTSGMTLLTGEERDNYLIENRLMTPQQVEDLNLQESGTFRYLADRLAAKKLVRMNAPAGGESRAYILTAPVFWARDQLIRFLDYLDSQK